MLLHIVQGAIIFYHKWKISSSENPDEHEIWGI